MNPMFPNDREAAWMDGARLIEAAIRAGTARYKQHDWRSFDNSASIVAAQWLNQSLRNGLWLVKMARFANASDLLAERDTVCANCAALDATTDAEGATIYECHRRAPPAISKDVYPLVDGDMELPHTNCWGPPTASLTVTKENVGAHTGTYWLKMAWVSSSNVIIYQECLEPGKRYRVTGVGKGDGTGASGGLPQVELRDPTSTTSYIKWTGTNSTDWQHFDFVMTVPGQPLNSAIGRKWGFTLRAQQVSTTGEYVGFDDIVVQEIDDARATFPIIGGASAIASQWCADFMFNAAELLGNGGVNDQVWFNVRKDSQCDWAPAGGVPIPGPPGEMVCPECPRMVWVEEQHLDIVVPPYTIANMALLAMPESGR